MAERSQALTHCSYEVRCGWLVETADESDVRHSSLRVHDAQVRNPRSSRCGAPDNEIAASHCKMLRCGQSLPKAPCVSLQNWHPNVAVGSEAASAIRAGGACPLRSRITDNVDAPGVKRRFVPYCGA